ncbi:MAG TPA: penicillin-binding transpeptidase domain-containing protein, partial [Candidatus Babeliaceae bacterium]|nr:penicillin-binding transpeptidase domain-containing protein [Candidatus Babeliaceae bacterium]
FLENLLGRKALYTDGFTIHTTLNSDMQRKAQEVYKKHIESYKKKYASDVDGALLALNVQTGAIRVLIGGYDFKRSQFNRALLAKRQIGSIFKPLVYVAALQRGVQLSETEIDEPITLKFGLQEWSPHNVNRKFKGPMTLAHALATSNNIISIKTLLRVGAQPVADLANSLHLTSPNKSIAPYPSLALGCIDTTLVQAAAMFNVFANKGVYEQPYSIEYIEDSWGKKIWKHKSVSENVLSWKVVTQVGCILRQAVDKLKVRFADIKLNVEALGKTGTADSQRTCWFAGSTPSYTTILYIGRDNGQQISDTVYAVNTAFPIWLETNSLFNQPIKNFNWDPSVSCSYIDGISGKSVKPGTYGSYEIMI